MSFPKNKINLKVLLHALAQQVEPLPADLQRSLTEIGQAIQANPTDEARIEIRELVAGYQPLEIVYRDALTKWNQNYVSQERTKSLDATFPMISGLDEVSIESFLPTNDWVNAAKQLTARIGSLQPSAKFWDKTDKIAVMTAGGIALGSAIAQLPGAIVGGAVGAGYGWYIGFRQATTHKSSSEKITSENVDRASAPQGGRSIVDNNEIDSPVERLRQREIDFCNISTEQLVMMAQEATIDAVKDLHQKGISTYGMRDGIIYETNPKTGTKSVVENDSQS